MVSKLAKMLVLPIVVSSQPSQGPGLSQDMMMDMVARQAVPDSCQEACPGARGFFSVFARRFLNLDDMGMRRLQGSGGIQPTQGGVLALICNNTEVLTCMTTEFSACHGNSGITDIATGVSFCTRESRREFVESEAVLGAAAAACEGHCTGALDVMGEVMLVQMESVLESVGTRRLSQRGFHGLMRRLGAHLGGPNLNMRARLMRVYCGNADVMSCATISTGTGYASCAGLPTPRGDAFTTNPEVLLSQCDTPLAVSVSMALTVVNPAEFVDDRASKKAVEAGIAAAASVNPSAVEVVLIVATARFEEGQLVLQANVNVDATIQAADADAVATLQTTVGNIEPATMTAAISTAFTQAVLDVTVEVAAMEEPVMAPTSNEAAAAEAAAASENTAKLKATVSLGVLAVIATVM